MCGEASQTFQNQAAVKKQEHVNMVLAMKEPIEDICRLVGAAQEACKRRRKLLFSKAYA